MAKLSEFCKINMGQSPDSSSYNELGNGMPFYQGNADFGEIHPKVRVWCGVPTKIAHPNDILISVRAPIGALNIADVECCIGRGLAALTADLEKCHQKYLWYALESKVDELNSKGTGSTFKAIGKSVLYDTEIPLPSISEQKEISDILDKVTTLIEARKDQLTALETLVKSRFIELFGEPLTNSKGWETECLFSVAPTKQIPFEFSDKVWLLNLDAVESNTGTVLFKNIVSDNEVNASTVMFSTDNVLYSKLRPYLNKVVLPDDKGVATSELLPLYPDKAKLNRVYLCYWLRSDAFVKHISEKVAGAKMPRVSMDYFRSIDIELPPIDLQNQFAEFVEQTDKLKFDILMMFAKKQILIYNLSCLGVCL